jgi:hypothetical protein
MTPLLSLQRFAAHNRRAVILLAIGFVLLGAVLIGKALESRSGAAGAPPNPATTSATQPASPPSATTAPTPSGPAPNYRRDPFAPAAG